MIQKKGLSQDERDILRDVLEDITWMAVRYAHGRHTVAPSAVRSAVRKIKEVYPDFKLESDRTLHIPKESELTGMNFKEDYLNDLCND
jgi:hypothetical protein